MPDKKTNKLGPVDELIIRIVETSKGPVTIKAIGDLLALEGLAYSDAALRKKVNKLLERGFIQKERIGAGSRARKSKGILPRMRAQDVRPTPGKYALGHMTQELPPTEPKGTKIPFRRRRRI